MIIFKFNLYVLVSNLYINKLRSLLDIYFFVIIIKVDNLLIYVIIY